MSTSRASRSGAALAAILFMTGGLVFSLPTRGEDTCGEPENDFIWWDGFSGTAVDQTVRAFTVFEGDLVIGGDFGSAGGMTSTGGVARWTTGGWTAIGTPPGGGVRALSVFDDQLIIAGSLANVPGIPGVSALARWDGTSWQSLGTDPPGGMVYALAVYDTLLIVGGALSNATSSLMAWDGATWFPFGETPDAEIRALAVDGDDLLVGGAFTHLGTLPANRVARWDGSIWNALGEGLDEVVYSLIVDGGNVIVGGGFTQAGGQPASHVSRWDGAWHAYGDGIDGDIRALRVYQGTLYAGGGYYDSDPSKASFLAAWTGSDWAPVGASPTCNVYAMTEFDSKLFVGGCFEEVGGFAAPYLAAWNSGAWDIGYSNYGNGLSWHAAAFQPYGDDLVVAGGFRHAGPDRVNRIALWDGSAWSDLAGGMDNQVRSLAMFEGDLIAGGFFSQAGGTPANRVARWNGSAWSPLGEGLGGGIVFDLLVYDGDLYAAGDILGNGIEAVARWDGSAWQPLGTGVSDEENIASAFALAEYDGKLIVGGLFTTAGGIEVNSIAAWDGTSWNALGSGMAAFDNHNEPYEPQVNDLKVFDGKLVAAGDFTIAGGNSGRHVAAWDGSDWTQVGAGLETDVYVLHVFEGRLIAGGPFLSADTRCMSRIAYWDGDAWKPMGTGVNGFVTGLGDFQGELYVGGPFTRAGASTSFGIARWETFQLLVPVRLLGFSAARRADGGATLAWDVADALDHLGFHVYREAGTEGRIRLTEELLHGRNHYEFVDSSPPAGRAAYWLAEVSRTGTESWLGPAELAAAAPLSLTLNPAHPNPLRSTTTIDYTLPIAGVARIAVFDVLGRRLATLVEAPLVAGHHRTSWNGTNDRGDRVAPGLFFIRLEEDGGRTITRRVLVLP